MALGASSPLRPGQPCSQHPSPCLMGCCARCTAMQDEHRVLLQSIRPSKCAADMIESTMCGVDGNAFNSSTQFYAGTLSVHSACHAFQTTVAADILASGAHMVYILGDKLLDHVTLRLWHALMYICWALNCIWPCTGLTPSWPSMIYQRSRRS